MWKQQGQQFAYNVLNPLIKLFMKVGITPNMITFIGLSLNILVGVVLLWGAEFGARGDHSYIAWAGLIILIAGLMDMLDGRLARVSGQASKYGALYDSVLDRYSELFMFLGICYYLVSHDYFVSSVFAFIAMIGSIMVSYTRARAEGLGVNCSVGRMQRPERILIVGTSATLCGIVSHFFGSDIKVELDWLPIPLFETITIFTFPIFVLAIWANITALERLKFAKDEFEKN